MAIVLNNVTSGYNISTINSNFQKIEDYVNDKLLARAATGVAGEAMMERDLDMNGNEILNYPVNVTNPNSLVTKSYVDAGDAAVQLNLDNAVVKTLRFPDNVPVMSSVAARAGSIQGYNTSGIPIPVFSYTDTADLAIKLNSSTTGLGAGLVRTVYDVTLESYITPLSEKLSNYGITAGQEATSALSLAFTAAASKNKAVIVDVNCIVDSVTIPAGITLVVLPGVTITHKASATGHMFIMSTGSCIRSENRQGKLRGNSANQSAVRRCISAVSVNNVIVHGLDIRDFNSYGGYFSGCSDTIFQYNTVREITGGAVETAAGEYITNCVRHLSYFNDIRDTGSNGIKFRADTLGLTDSCVSIGDRVYRAGFIGIANGTCQNHLVKDSYCVDCADNGVDMNGCYNAIFDGGISIRCQDGFYIGENNINNCHIRNVSAISCKRSGIGSLGSLTRCTVSNFTIDACGAGIYCSGFVGFDFKNGIITNSVKQSYYDNESASTKTSTGIGIDLQSNLSACYFPSIQEITFYNNEGRDIQLGSSGTIGSLIKKNCVFMDSAGDGKISYGGATLDSPLISSSIGYLTERTQVYSLAGDGVTTDFTLSLPQTVTDTAYRIVSVVPDWLTTYRYLDSTKTTSLFGISFGTAPPSGTRRVNITFERLRPV